MFPTFVYQSSVSDLSPNNNPSPAVPNLSGVVPPYSPFSSQRPSQPSPAGQDTSITQQGGAWPVQYSSPGSVQSSSTLSCTPPQAYMLPGHQPFVWSQAPPLTGWPPTLPQPLQMSQYIAANGQPMHIVMDTSSASPHSSSIQAASMSTPYALLNIQPGHQTFLSSTVLPAHMSMSDSTSYNSNSARNFAEMSAVMPFKTMSPAPQRQQQQQQQQHKNQQQLQQQQQRRQHSVSTWGYALVDQLHPFLSRVPVPPSAIFEETAAMLSYNNDVVASSVQPCASSVCLLFSNTDRCDMGQQCRSFHVKREYLALSRAEERPLCCALHNCFYSQEMLSSGSAKDILQKWYCVSMDLDGGAQLVPISLLSIGITVALETLPVHEGRHVISMRRHVCRLHLEGRCKWTKDCGHVHVCREVYQLLLNESVRAFVQAILNRSENSTRLYSRITSSEAVQSYVRSSAGVPLLAELIANGDVEGINALLRGRVACTQNQWEHLQSMANISVPIEITLLVVSPKVAPFLVPSAHKAVADSAPSTPSHHGASRS